MIWLYFYWSLIAVFFSISVYYSKIHKFFKFLTFVIILVFGFMMNKTFEDTLGGPIHGFPVGEFQYVHHSSTLEETYLWANVENVGNKLYVFDYDRETEKKLQKMKEGQDSWIGEFSTKNNGLGGNFAAGEELDIRLKPRDGFEK